MVGEDDDSVSTESSSATPSCTYGDMLDVMDHAPKPWIGLAICRNAAI